jgi:hypothetical protein
MSGCVHVAPDVDVLEQSQASTDFEDRIAAGLNDIAALAVPPGRIHES